MENAKLREELDEFGNHIDVKVETPEGRRLMIVGVELDSRTGDIIIVVE